jgi:hypothetical protein
MKYSLDYITENRVRNKNTIRRGGDRELLSNLALNRFDISFSN